MPDTQQSIKQFVTKLWTLRSTKGVENDIWNGAFVQIRRDAGYE